MRVLADEKVDRPLVAGPRHCARDVCWLAECAPAETKRGALGRAWREGRVVLTLDRDFGYLVLHAGLPVSRLVYIRLAACSPGELLLAFQAVWPRMEARIAGHFVVVTRNRVRVRPPQLPAAG
ncbi:MAG: DUF5615 family PIN-like protein [Planctomycetota bacterium]